MFASIFQTLIIKPIFNLLVFIYALLPGHNFGLSIIIFTIAVRLLMWPLVKKQLHQTKAMRALQPQLKRIKQDAKGNKQKESAMLMELYKEKGVSPFGSIGTLVVQLIVLIGLYQGLRQVVTNPHALISNSYGFLQHFGWMKVLAADIHRFDASLFGFINLSRSALHAGSGIYWPAMALVAGSAAIQYFQSAQLLPNDKSKRSLRTILKDAGGGKSADQSEVSAAVGRSTRYFIPVMIFLFTVNLPSALSLYWLTSGLVAYLQQAKVLKGDETEMEAIADEPTKKDIIEGEVIPPKKRTASKPAKKKTPGGKRKKR